MTSMLVPAMDLMTCGFASKSFTLVMLLACSIFTTMLLGRGLKATVPQLTPRIVAPTLPTFSSCCCNTPKHTNNNMSTTRLNSFQLPPGPVLAIAELLPKLLLLLLLLRSLVRTTTSNPGVNALAPTYNALQILNENGYKTVETVL